MPKAYYNPSDFGGNEEVEMMRKFYIQSQDARQYFYNFVKPRLDRAYKLYIAFNGDRARQINEWQSNIFVPYIQSVIETLMPRILDARPDFSVVSRNAEGEGKAVKQNQLMNYFWELTRGDKVLEDLVRSTLVFGLGFLQVSWKKDVREHRFLRSTDLSNPKLLWKKETRTFYDAPYLEWVDNYNLWYDWHNIARESKQFWFKRLVLTGAEIRRRYPLADKERLEIALTHYSGDLSDYASIRNQVKQNHYLITKGADHVSENFSVAGSVTNVGGIYQSNADPDLRMHEIFEWTRPFDDAYAIVCNYVPILKDGFIPIPFDFKEAQFIDVPYLRMPNEFEGYGVPLILENPQIMLNMIKNQRLDAATMNIHKMWIVNPLANVKKDELVVRPFGIIYSPDPNGVREVQFSDIKSSAYQEEELLKNDMKYASGVDDFSMGANGQASSATEIRHLRESTLERVRLFVNHLGDGLSIAMRYMMDMQRQFWTKPFNIRVLGDDGQNLYPLIEKDDLEGSFDYRSNVLPSIAGQQDLEKKQGMDLFQLLINLPFVDPQKLVTKILVYFDWDISSISKDTQGAAPGVPQPGDPSAAAGGVPGMPPDASGAAPSSAPQGPPPGGAPQAPSIDGMAQPPLNVGGVPINVAQAVMQKLGVSGVRLPGQTAASPSPFAQASAPLSLSGSQPPTVGGVSPQQGSGGPKTNAGRVTPKTTNPRGFNRGGKVNTDININQNSSPESKMMRDVNNLNK